MSRDFILKTILLIIGISFILLLWFGFGKIDDQATEIESLKQENDELKEEIEYLENLSSGQTEIIEESEIGNITESINVFIDSVYHVQEGNYLERKSNAETVLTQSMINELFPEDEEYDLIYEYNIRSSDSYINQTSEDEASAYVTFNQTESNLNNDDEKETKVTIEVFLQKEGDNWLINNFQQVTAEPLG